MCLQTTLYVAELFKDGFVFIFGKCWPKFIKARKLCSMWLWYTIVYYLFSCELCQVHGVLRKLNLLLACFLFVSTKYVPFLAILMSPSNMNFIRVTFSQPDTKCSHCCRRWMVFAKKMDLSKMKMLLKWYKVHMHYYVLRELKSKSFFSPCFIHQKNFHLLGLTSKWIQNPWWQFL